MPDENRAGLLLLAVVTMPLLARAFEVVLRRPFGFQAPAGAPRSRARGSA